MATVATKLYTADEFWEWRSRHGRDDVRYELDRGVIVEMPPPGELHGLICFLIARLIGNWLFEQGKGYACTNDTEMLVETNPDTLRGPDLMVFDECITPETANRKFSQRIPKLVVEVLSPDDRPGRTNRRIMQYLQRGVPLVWLVDPEEKTVTVYRPHEHHQVLDEADDLHGGDALPGLRCRVADFFRVLGQLAEGQP